MTLDRPTRRGTVDRSAVRSLTQAELDTAERLAAVGHNVVFVPARGTGPTADALVDGVLWEIKTPTTAKRDTVVKALREGRRQCRNIVLDLTRSPLGRDRQNVIAMIEYVHGRYDGIDRLWVIDHVGQFVWSERG